MAVHELLNWLKTEMLKADNTTTLVFGSVLFFLTCYMMTRDRPKLPPGPWNWPIVGNLIPLAKGKQNSKMTYNWSKKYGRIFTFKTGSHRIVMLADYDSMVEAFVNKADYFSDRVSHIEFVGTNFKGIHDGLIFNNGHTWKKMREFVAPVLSEKGVGKKTPEEYIQEEVSIFMEEISKMEGKEIQIYPMAKLVSSNLNWCLIYGKRFDYKDSTFQQLNRSLRFMFDNVPPYHAEFFFPWLKYFRCFIPSISRKLRASVNERQKLRDIFCDQVAEHEKTYNRTNMRDYTDLYLEVLKEKKDPDTFTEKSVFTGAMDLFSASAENLSDATTWAILYMLHYPGIQSKVQQEIDEVVGRNHQLQYSDHSKLHYTWAVIHEVMRDVGIVNVTIPHYVAKEGAVIAGYDIPVGTMIWANIYAIHRDPKYWTDPETFNPNRWLNEDGHFVMQKGFVQFGLGNRRCAGEYVGKMALLNIIGTMLQKFSFAPPEGSMPPSLDDFTHGNTTVAPHYKCFATPR